MDQTGRARKKIGTQENNPPETWYTYVRSPVAREAHANTMNKACTTVICRGGEGSACAVTMLRGVGYEREGAGRVGRRVTPVVVVVVVVVDGRGK